MAQSFYHLTPHNDPQEPYICEDCRAMSAEEEQALRQAAFDIGEALLDALDTYTDVNPETSYRAIFLALRYMDWRLRHECEEDAADA